MIMTEKSVGNLEEVWKRCSVLQILPTFEVGTEKDLHTDTEVYILENCL